MNNITILYRIVFVFASEFSDCSHIIVLDELHNKINILNYCFAYFTNYAEQILRELR